MLYYGEDVNLTEQKTCGHARYKPNMGRGRTLVTYKKLWYVLITPRIQMLFMSLKTSKHMKWHHSHDVTYRVWSHGVPSNGETWKKIDMVHPNFSMKSWNVHLGLCTYEFNLFGLFDALYSYWPIILTIYNLPLRICMRLKFMFYLQSYLVLTVLVGIYICLSSTID
jgi:hypothetical protein